MRNVDSNALKWAHRERRRENNGIKSKQNAGWFFGVLGECAPVCTSPIPVSFGPATPTFRASSSSSSEAEAVSRVFCRHLPASSCYFDARCLRSCFFITSRAQNEEKTQKERDYKKFLDT